MAAKLVIVLLLHFVSSTCEAFHVPCVCSDVSSPRAFSRATISMCASKREQFRTAGPSVPPPVYSDDSLFDQLGIKLFRNGMAKSLGYDVPTAGYAGLMELARGLNEKFKPKEAQHQVRVILRGLFPVFIIKLFPLMFSGPFPAFSAKLNAWITLLTCRWLMGPMELVDVPADEVQPNWGDGVKQGLKIERCRFLEESACASVCINTCKVPTQAFFIKDMGIPLSMEPDYETFECKFKFGKLPLSQAQDPVFSTPCFLQCPSKGALRTAHSKFSSKADKSGTDKAPTAVPSTLDPAQCGTIIPLEASAAAESRVPSRAEYMARLQAWLEGVPIAD